ncbi:hypothetical protein BACERE00184_05029 [Bacillus cereus]|nr:hypothetical protein BACERE00184_05029 [Bacillus cereus]
MQLNEKRAAAKVTKEDESKFRKQEIEGKEIIKVSIVTAISGQTFLLHQALGGEQAKNTQIGKADEKIQEIDKLLRR